VQMFYTWSPSTQAIRNSWQKARGVFNDK